MPLAPRPMLRMSHPGALRLLSPPARDENTLDLNHFLDQARSPDAAPVREAVRRCAA